MPSSSEPSASAGPSPGARFSTSRSSEKYVRAPTGEPDRHGSRAADPLAFLEEIEGDRADQRARAEGEHDSDDPIAPVAKQAKLPADDQRRGGQRAPTEGRQHRRHATASPARVKHNRPGTGECGRMADLSRNSLPIPDIPAPGLTT